MDERETHEDDEEDEEHYMVTKTKELTKHVTIIVHLKLNLFEAKPILKY